MRRFLHGLALVLAAWLAGCATALETVHVPADNAGWKFASGSDRTGRTLAEFVPAGESAQRWSRLLTIQFLEGERRSPQAVMEQLKATLQARCPDSSWTVIHQDDWSVLYEWKTAACGNQPEQHEIARLLKGNEGVHRIAYVEMVRDISAPVHRQWVLAFMNAHVEKGGRKVMVGR